MFFGSYFVGLILNLTLKMQCSIKLSLNQAISIDIRKYEYREA